jgi:hypothetical protein
VSSLTGTDVHRLISYKDQLQGRAFVKRPDKSQSEPLSSALSVIFNKYSTPVKEEVYNSPNNIEIFYDNICVETDNYIVIDKIVYENGEFIAPSTKNNVFTLTNRDVSPFSNKFYNEKDNTLMFCTIQQVNALSATNTKAFYPNITKYNLETGISENVYPKNTTDNVLSYTFNLSSLFSFNFNVNIVSVKKPALSYNSFNDVYKLTYMGMDNNNLFHLFDISFDIVNSDIRFLDAKFYKADKTCLTTNFASSGTIFTNINSVSGSYAISQANGILSL